MKAADLFGDIRAYCQAHTNPKIVEKYARYFTEGFDAYGLSREDHEAKVKTLMASGKLSKRLVLSTSKLLIKSGKHEETSFAIILLKEFVDEFDDKTLPAIEQWFKIGIYNWAHCDVLCDQLMTPLFEKQLIKYKDLGQWRSAQNKYQRRAVPVAMLPLLKTQKSFKPLFTFIEPLMMDPEKKVQQGLGWFLREAWKLQPKDTETFLLKWKNESPRTIFQYATEKMSPQQKKRFKKEKPT